MHLNFETNDPKRGLATYLVSADSRTALAVTPRAVDFGQVAEGSGPTVRVRVRDGEGEAITSREGISYSVGSPHFVVERDEEAEEFVLAVSLAPDAPCAVLVSELQLQSADEQPVVVPVSASVVGPVAVAPQVGAMRPRDDGRLEARMLVWRTDGEALGPVERIDAPPGVSLEEIGHPVANRRFFAVQAPPTAEWDEAAVRVSFEGFEPGAVLRLRLPDSRPMADLDARSSGAASRRSPLTAGSD